MLSQVALSQLIEVQGGRWRHAVLNRFVRLVADFVVCTRAFEVVAVLELDDRSHEIAARAAADARKTDFLAAAGYKLIRVHVSKMPSVVELQSLILRPEPATATAGKVAQNPVTPGGVFS